MLAMRATLAEFAMKMEGYILSGVQGIIHSLLGLHLAYGFKGLRHTYRDTILVLKREAAQLINEKLRKYSAYLISCTAVLT